MDLWQIFSQTVFTFYLLIEVVLKEVFFWLETEFLISLSLGLFISNVIRYFRVQHVRTPAVVTQIVYVLYLFGKAAVALYYEPLAMSWWEWALTSPYLIVSFFYSLLKTTKLGRWLFNYWNMHIYYVALSIPFCVMDGGSWWGSLSFAIIMLMSSNLGGLYREKTE